MIPFEVRHRDGFQIRRNTFPQPENTVSMDPAVKRRLTICNLFVNHHLSLTDITRVLDEDYGRVVSILIEHSIICDRRKHDRNVSQPKSASPRKNRNSAV
ncbi:MAG: hypothetical protein U0V70_05815 [Terriglobia bacterium]